MVNETYSLSPHVVSEFFENGALILRLDDHKVIELNITASTLIKLTNGIQNVDQVATAFAEEFDISKSLALQDVIELYMQFLAQKIVERVDPNPGREEPSLTVKAQSSYFCNPIVTLHENDKLDGVLFNPISNEIRVLNTTGIFIWKLFQNSQNINAVIKRILDEFENSKVDEVELDIQCFFEDLVNIDFIRLVKPA